MIILEPKPFEEIKNILREYKKISIVGCGQCAKINLVGGEGQVEEMREKLESDGKEVLDGIVVDVGICYLTSSRDKISLINTESDAILVLACGAAVQSIVELDPSLNPLPGANTRAFGIAKKIGDYSKKCSLCGDCILHLTGGICPIARCPKGMFKGPCGDSVDGKCGVTKKSGIDPEMNCVWVEIFERKGKKSNILLKTNPKDWSKSASIDIKLTDDEIIGGRKK